MEYPKYFITKTGCKLKKHPKHLSQDNTPRYCINPNSPNNSYSLKHCLDKYEPRYKKQSI